MRIWCAISATCLTACSNTSGSDGGPQDGAGDDAGTDVELDPCGFDEARAATIDVSERSDRFHQVVYSRIEARLREGPDPEFHDVVLEQGACRYFQPAFGFCDPPCNTDEICTLEDECLPYPVSASGGTLTITGVAGGGAIDVESKKLTPGTYLGPTGLPGDSFDENDTVGATLSGDTFSALSLQAKGVAAMDTDLTANGFEMISGEDAEITWTPGPDADACVQVFLFGFNASHGAPLDDIIRCEGPDSGSLAIPMALVDDFPIGETPKVTESYDWPHSELTRYTRNTQQVQEGPAALVVRSTTYFRLSHAK